MKRVVAVVLLTMVAACSDHRMMGPSGPSSMTSLTGTWTGSGVDSSSQGGGGLMGQTGMGSMTWPLTQVGSTVTGSLNFSGMPGRMPGRFSGTISGDEMPFTMEMPAGSMMASGCWAEATGTLHIDWATMMMTGTYAGSNSCTGQFDHGQFTMIHG